MKLRCWNNEICRVSALKLEFLVVVKLKEISASGIEKSKGKKMEGHPWASWPHSSPRNRAASQSQGLAFSPCMTGWTGTGGARRSSSIS